MIFDKKVYAIITAAGNSSRMNMDISKQLLKIGNITMIERTINKFLASKYIDEIIVVIKKEEQKIMTSIINKIKSNIPIKTVFGGKTREESSFNGIKEIYDDAIAVMHDGARPFIKTADINNLLENFEDKSALITAVPVKDTIKFINNDMTVDSTPDRSRLYMIQTPQIFDLKLLKDAYKYFIEKNIKVTDDSSLVEALGKKVFVMNGSYDNIKITTAEDIKLAETIAQEEDNENW